VSDDFAPPERAPTQPAEPVRIGEVLADARRERGLSVEDVAGATRIRATLIRTIEADDFSRCGGAVYARGHIRSIAQVVGADARELVAEYDRQHDNPVPTLTANPLPALPSFEPTRVTGRPSARWATAAIVVLLVAAVFLGLSWFAGRTQHARGPGTAGAAPSTPNTSAPGGESSNAAPTTTPPPTTPPVKGVSLRVRAVTGESWLLVTSSTGAQVYQGILANGQAMDFRDGRALTVKFGNSGAVTLTLNGRDLGAPRCGGRVCSLQFAPNSATAG
jgi:cytoskeleton protein RodZ